MEFVCIITHVTLKGSLLPRKYYVESHDSHTDFQSWLIDWMTVQSLAFRNHDRESLSTSMDFNVHFLSKYLLISTHSIQLYQFLHSPLVGGSSRRFALSSRMSMESLGLRCCLVPWSHKVTFYCYIENGECAHRVSAQLCQMPSERILNVVSSSPNTLLY